VVQVDEPAKAVPVALVTRPRYEECPAEVGG
jgi:hypothetical protein